jgi:hypothetical protein
VVSLDHFKGYLSFLAAFMKIYTGVPEVHGHRKTLYLAKYRKI